MSFPWSVLSGSGAGFRAGVPGIREACGHECRHGSLKGRSTVLLGLLVGTLLAAQGLAPDELRARSGPYVPPPPPNTLRTQVTLVEVPVVVRDGKHRAIAGLKQSAFQVFDAGKMQAITAFSVETFTPRADPLAAPSTDGGPPSPSPAPSATAEHPQRFIMLCFDNLSTDFTALKLTKAAAERFVKTALAPDDRVAVVTTAWSRTVSFTSEAPKLIESIEKVTPQPRYSDDAGGQCPRITGYQAYLITNGLDNDTLEGVVAEDMACKNLRHGPAVQDVTSLARMVWEHARSNSENTLYAIGGLVDVLGKLPGRRMLLLASSGFLSGNLEYLEDELIAKALRAEVVINSIDAKGLYTISPGRPIEAPPAMSRSPRTQIAEARISSRQVSAKDDAMAVLAQGTGGAFYHNSNDLDKGVRELGAMPDVMYVLGFSPADATPDGRYHALKVKLAAGNHYSVQARMGYTAAARTPPPEPRPLSRLDSELMASDTLTDVPMRITSEPGPPENGHPMLAIAVHVDVSQLRFDTRADRRVQKLAFLVALLDARSAFIVGRQAEVELALKPDSFDRLARSGFNVTLPLQAPPGTYTLRGLVEESLEGKMSASSSVVELR